MSYSNQGKNLSNDFQIVGNSDKIINLLETVNKLNLSEATVLIYGESGTGKELLARYIHNNSRRRDNNFVAINCAAIPNKLLENEFFGHKKGAYTDAVDDYAGKFGIADNGTIFLDEVADLDILLQAKLLRVIQFKEYEPVGSNVVNKTDVRIIAASNKDLLQLIKEKKFREDLYYRLSVIPIYMPSLLERNGDIELLADFFLKKYGEKNNKNIKGFSTGVIDSFKKHSWHGNVRELENIIERAVIFCDSDYISIKDIRFDFENNLKKSDNSVKSLKDAINCFKKDYIIRVLDKNGWNQTKAAKVLDIQRTYLSRLINELGIDKI